MQKIEKTCKSQNCFDCVQQNRSAYAARLWKFQPETEPEFGNEEEKK